jgi:hypothetical protein
MRTHRPDANGHADALSSAGRVDGADSCERLSACHLGAAIAVRVSVPIRTVSEMNLREHWSKRAKRKKEQGVAIALVLNPTFIRSMRAWGSGVTSWAVTLTRVAPRLLDADNLAASNKGVQDSVARVIGVDDRHIAWTYAQRKGSPKDYAVEIAITAERG